MNPSSSVLNNSAPVVGVIMGSSSDWEVMRHAVDMLTQFKVPHEVKVISAHRMPSDMAQYGADARERGVRAIIAGAGRCQRGCRLPHLQSARPVRPMRRCTPLPTWPQQIPFLLSSWTHSANSKRKRRVPWSYRRLSHLELINPCLKTATAQS